MVKTLQGVWNSQFILIFRRMSRIIEDRGKMTRGDTIMNVSSHQDPGHGASGKRNSSCDASSMRGFFVAIFAQYQSKNRALNQSSSKPSIEYFNWSFPSVAVTNPFSLSTNVIRSFLSNGKRSRLLEDEKLSRTLNSGLTFLGSLIS